MIVPAAAAGDGIRLITLAPHLTELIYEIGAEDRLVGAVEWSNHPPEARELPRIGDAFRFDLERILELGATHGLAWSGGTPAPAIRELRALGVEVLEVSIRNLEDIGAALESIGAWLNAEAGGRRAAERFTSRLDALKQDRPELPEVSVFYQVSSRPLYTLGGRHVINPVLALCGADNPFAGLDTEAAVIEIESVLRADPFAMVAGQSAPGDRPLARWEEFDGLQAVRCGRLLAVDPALLVRPTPRILDGAEVLCEWLDGLRRAEDRACENARD